MFQYLSISKDDPQSLVWWDFAHMTTSPTPVVTVAYLTALEKNTSIRRDRIGRMLVRNGSNTTSNEHHALNSDFIERISGTDGRWWALQITSLIIFTLELSFAIKKKQVLLLSLCNKKKPPWFILAIVLLCALTFSCRSTLYLDIRRSCKYRIQSGSAHATLHSHSPVPLKFHRLLLVSETSYT